MNKYLSIKFILIITFFIPIAYYIINYFYNLNEILIQNINGLSVFIFENFLISISLFSIFNFLMVLLNFPGGSLRAIITGYYFGTKISILIIIVSSTIAAFILFLFYKKNASIDFKNKKLVGLLSMLNLNKDINFLILRLLPVIPFFIQNIVAAQFKLDNTKFILITFIGILPINLLYTAFGSQLKNISEFNSIEYIYHFYDPRYLMLILFSLLAYFLLIKLSYKIFNK